MKRLLSYLAGSALLAVALVTFAVYLAAEVFMLALKLLVLR